MIRLVPGDMLAEDALLAMAAAVDGDSLRSDNAFMFANPPIAMGVTVASEPPVMMMSASPYWIVRYASPIACALVAHAEIVA